MRSTRSYTKIARGGGAGNGKRKTHNKKKVLRKKRYGGTCIKIASLTFDQLKSKSMTYVGLKAYIDSWLNFCMDQQSVVNKIKELTKIEGLNVQNIRNKDEILKILNTVNPQVLKIDQDVISDDYKEQLYNSENDLHNIFDFVTKSRQQKQLSVRQQPESKLDEESLMKNYIEELGVLENLKNILKLDVLGYPELNNIKNISEIILDTVDYVKKLDKSGKSDENYDERDRSVKKWLKSIKRVFHPDTCSRYDPQKKKSCDGAFQLVNSVQDAERDDDAK